MNTEHRLEIAFWGMILIAMDFKMIGDMTTFYTVAGLAVAIYLGKIAYEVLHKEHHGK